jgi:hypothetical protein
MHAARRAGDSAKPDSGHRNRVERRGVVLGDVVAKETSLIGGGNEAQAFVKLRCERAIVAVDVVEQSEFHLASDP